MAEVDGQERVLQELQGQLVVHLRALEVVERPALVSLQTPLGRAIPVADLVGVVYLEGAGHQQA